MEKESKFSVFFSVFIGSSKVLCTFQFIFLQYFLSSFSGKRQTISINWIGNFGFFFYFANSSSVKMCKKYVNFQKLNQVVSSEEKEKQTGGGETQKLLKSFRSFFFYSVWKSIGKSRFAMRNCLCEKRWMRTKCFSTTISNEHFNCKKFTFYKLSSRKGSKKLKSNAYNANI